MSADTIDDFLTTTSGTFHRGVTASALATIQEGARQQLEPEATTAEDEAQPSTSAQDEPPPLVIDEEVTWFVNLHFHDYFYVIVINCRKMIVQMPRKSEMHTSQVMSTTCPTLKRTTGPSKFFTRITSLL